VTAKDVLVTGHNSLRRENKRKSLSKEIKLHADWQILIPKTKRISDALVPKSRKTQ